MHELAHLFGGDRSAAFSHALSELMEITLSQARLIADAYRGISVNAVNNAVKFCLYQNLQNFGIFRILSASEFTEF